MPPIRRLWHIAQPPKKLLLGVTGLLLVETVATLTIPWVGGRFAEDVLQHPEVNTYHQLLLIWLGLLLTQNALRFVGNYLLGKAGAAATARLRCRIYDHLQALPLHYHQERQAGDMLSLLSRDAAILGQFFTTTLPSVAPLLLTMAGAWFLMARQDTTIAILIGLSVPFIAVSVRLLLRRLRPIANQLADAHGSHLSIVEENLRLLQLLKAFGKEDLESARILQKNSRILTLEKRQLLIISMVNPAVQTAGAFLLIAMLWLSADKLTQGDIAVGQLVSLLLYGLFLFRPASQLADAAGRFQSTLGASARIEKMLATETEPYEKGHPTAPAHPGNISFEHITFQYPGGKHLLSDFSLQIAEGETIAVVGPNGAGKSTLVNLLLRFITPQQGRILLDRQDTQELTLGTLRSLIGLVPQEVALLNDSVRANITFGITDASDQAISKVIDIAQATAFIAHLPHGLDTLIGAEGTQLSGGQKQRIALARALLRGCPILILDEATSMFDPAALTAFLRDFKAESLSHTVILITHQADKLAIADRIITMEPTR